MMKLIEVGLLESAQTETKCLDNPLHGLESQRHLRLNFSHPIPEQIREGMRRLSVAVKKQLTRVLM
jgi:hypothetical protein